MLDKRELGAVAGTAPVCLTNSITVGVVIPTYNHARFLAEAISSVLAQTRPADEIIVVDDGSTDDPISVVAQFPQIRIFRQNNRGLSAARNTGLRVCGASHIVFLDADDRLLPSALEAGLACFALRPDSAFVYGGYRRISEKGNLLGSDIFTPMVGDAHLTLLRFNIIQMHATVLYRRVCLLAVDGFDENLRRLEDHDIYLRIAQRYSVASHPAIVAEYRKHDQNMSDDYAEQLRTALYVLDRHELRLGTDSVARAAWRDGRTNKQAHYVSAMLAMALARWRERHNIGVFLKDVGRAGVWSPRATMRVLFLSCGRRIKKMLPRAAIRLIERKRGRAQ